MDYANNDQQSPPVALLLGGGGFIGGFIAGALHRHGWRVIRTVRPSSRKTGDDERLCDITRMRTPEDWFPVLEGVDAVINAAGILRESGNQTFSTVHYEAPLSLARACIAQGVGHFIQISALGHEADGEFIASKHRFDEALSALPLASTILRPSVVYSASGSYGGSSLLRAMAAVPGAMPIPGDGHWQLQPVAAEDLAEMVLDALQQHITGTFEVGGPEPISLLDYQQTWRRWLRIPGKRLLKVPASWVGLVVKMGELAGRGPMGETMWRMLQNGNVLSTGATEKNLAHFGSTPRSLQQALAATPSQVQDRWQAQLYFLMPILLIAIALLCLLSAWAGFATPSAHIEQMTTGSWLQHLHPVALARTGAAIDLVLGVWLLSYWRPRTALLATLAMVLAYTVILGIGLPALWLDPLGGLAKNLVLIPALLIAWILTDGR